MKRAIVILIISLGALEGNDRGIYPAISGNPEFPFSISNISSDPSDYKPNYTSQGGIYWVNPTFSKSCYYIPKVFYDSFPSAFPGPSVVCKQYGYGIISAYEGFWNAKDLDRNGLPDIPIHQTEEAMYVVEGSLCLPSAPKVAYLTTNETFILYQSSPRVFIPTYIGVEKDTFLRWYDTTLSKYVVDSTFRNRKHVYGITVNDINSDGFDDIITVYPQKVNARSEANPKFAGGGCVFWGPTYTTYTCTDSLYGDSSDPKFWPNHIAITNNPKKIFVSAEGYIGEYHPYQGLIMVDPITFTAVKVSDSCADAVAAGDINNDGFDDIVCGTSMYNADNYPLSPKGLFYLLGPSYSSTVTIIDSNLVHDLIIYDINGDGWNDIIAAGQRGPDGDSISIIVFYNNGTPTPSFTQRFYKSPYLKYNGPGGTPQEIDIGDINCDGNMDVVVVAEEPNFFDYRYPYGDPNVIAFVNDGSYPYPNFIPIPIAAGTNSYGEGETYNYGILVNDFDLDGKTDIAISSVYFAPETYPDSGFLCILWNNSCVLGSDDELSIQEKPFNLSSSDYVEIFDISGRRIYEGKYGLANLKKGIYLIKSGRETRKIIIK